MATIADAPPDVMRNLVHDRTVRIAERTREVNDPNADAESAATEPLGFVSFDVRGRTVHVTQLGGGVDVAERLLAEPVRFAAAEGLDVAFVVSESADDLREAAERAGFAESGPGPRFRAEATVEYRLDPN